MRVVKIGEELMLKDFLMEERHAETRIIIQVEGAYQLIHLINYVCSVTMLYIYIYVNIYIYIYICV